VQPDFSHEPQLITAKPFAKAGRTDLAPGWLLVWRAPPDFRLRNGRRSGIFGRLKKIFLALLLLAALAAVTRAQGIAPGMSKEARATIQSALADFDRKKYDDALAKLLELEKKSPDDAFVMNLVGAAYTKKKDYDTAKSYFDRAVEKEPGFFAAKFNLGELLFLQKKYPEALGFFRSMLDQVPGNELLQFKVFLCEMLTGNDAGAKAMLSKIKYPGDTPAWYYAQAAWETKSGNKKKAIQYLTGAKYIFGPKTALFDETFEDLQIKVR